MQFLGKLGHHLRMRIPQIPLTSNLLWSSWRYTAYNKQERVIWDLVVAAVIGDFRERNNIILNHSVRSVEQSFYVCLTFISHWLNLLSDMSRELAERACLRRQLSHKARATTPTWTSCDQWRSGLLTFGSSGFQPVLCSRLSLYFISGRVWCYCLSV